MSEYERLAPDFGYKTRDASAVPWEDVPAANKALMTATSAAVLAALSSAGYRVIKAAETETELGSDNCECGEVHPDWDVYSVSGFKMTHQRSVFRTAWLPVEQEGPE